jgi:hypothetical protein
MAMTRRVLIAGASAVWLLSVLVQQPMAAQERQAVAAHAAVSFETSDSCLACHNGLMTPEGEDVSIGVSWRASMMANSSRDPYWQASVRRETIDHASSTKAIQDECATCHMPMARAAAHAAGREGEVLALLPSVRGGSDQHRLAADGVSCTLCHQIGPDRLGTRESFNGGFALGPPEDGYPRMFGPFDTDQGRTTIMRSATGVRPAKAEHLRKSEVCATCHTLYTNALGPKGEVIGSLPEQMPYLEWRHSALVEDRSCQSCHMPAAADTPIASVLGEPREQLARHSFLGGNFFMLRMLNRFRGELGVTAPARELEAAAQATLLQLRTETASVAITRAEIDGGQLEADVLVRNLTGHKLPTGYPSRRVWLHAIVRDRAGRVVFESGAITAEGLIQGNDNDADGGRVEPHHDEIRSPGQVQVYESVMARPDGTPTTGLLQATQFLKDNRLLPRGFDKTTADKDIATVGEALQDVTFTDAGDRVRYLVPVERSAGPFAIEVELRYQPIGFRWATNLRDYDAPEPRRFVGYYESMAAAASTMLASALTTVR